jgi:hypothetical protein
MNIFFIQCFYLCRIKSKRFFDGALGVWHVCERCKVIPVVLSLQVLGYFVSQDSWTLCFGSALAISINMAADVSDEALNENKAYFYVDFSLSVSYL